MAEEEVALMSQDEAYEVLGLPKGVDWSEIKHAYKKLALKYHPDKNSEAPKAAAANFKRVSRAYTTLTGGQVDDGNLREEEDDMYTWYDAAMAAATEEEKREIFQELFMRMFGDDLGFSEDMRYWCPVHGWHCPDIVSSDYDDASSGSYERERKRDEALENNRKQFEDMRRYREEMRKERERKQREECKLEKLKRPKLVSRTDTSITLAIRGYVEENGSMPSDRCWELAVKEEGSKEFTTHRSQKGKTTVCVSDLQPATKYIFQARLGRMKNGEVTDFGPYSVESPYSTTGEKQSNGKMEEKKESRKAGKKQRDKRDRDANSEHARKRQQEQDDKAEQAKRHQEEVLKERQEALAKVTQTMAEKEAEELERLAKATQASSALKDGSDSSAQGSKKSRRQRKRHNRKKNRQSEPEEEFGGAGAEQSGNEGGNVSAAVREEVPTAGEEDDGINTQQQSPFALAGEVGNEQRSNHLHYGTHKWKNDTYAGAFTPTAFSGSLFGGNGAWSLLGWGQAGANSLAAPEPFTRPWDLTEEGPSMHARVAQEPSPNTFPRPAHPASLDEDELADELLGAIEGEEPK